MPESVDTSKPGVLELTTKDITTVRVERASQQVNRCGVRCKPRLIARPLAQSDEVHVFRGKEEPAREIECVLIFDPESGVSVTALLSVIHCGLRY